MALAYRSCAEIVFNGFNGSEPGALSVLWGTGRLQAPQNRQSLLIRSPSPRRSIWSRGESLGSGRVSMSEHEQEHLLPFPSEISSAGDAHADTAPPSFAIVRCDQPASNQPEEITGLLVGPMGRVLRLLDHHGLGYLLYRYRYLAC